MLNRILAAHCPNCQVTFVDNGADGLLYLNRPVMNGFETLSALKAEPLYWPIPVVILTTLQESTDRASKL